MKHKDCELCRLNIAHTVAPLIGVLNSPAGQKVVKTMTDKEKIAQLEKEKADLQAQINNSKSGELRLKVTEKGGLSVYNLGRFPVTLYKEQWLRLLDRADDIRAAVAPLADKVRKAS